MCTLVSHVIKHRVRRNGILNEHRERIVRAFEDPREEYLLVADMLWVNRQKMCSVVWVYADLHTTMFERGVD